MVARCKRRGARGASAFCTDQCPSPAVQSGDRRGSPSSCERPALELCSPPHFRRRYAEVACQVVTELQKLVRPTSTAEEVRAFLWTDQPRNPQHRRRVSVACPRNRPENGAVAIWGGSRVQILKTHAIRLSVR